MCILKKALNFYHGFEALLKKEKLRVVKSLSTEGKTQHIHRALDKCCKSYKFNALKEI